MNGRWAVVTFDHEKLDAYHSALEFLRIASQLTCRWPRGHGYLKDQLNRASLSIVANVAEGAGEFMPADKARFYRMASRSATECAAICDACRTLNLGDPARLEEGRRVLLSIVRMLTGLAKRHQRAL